ncbi:MAG: hypothetical protein V1750_02175, partial [Acidobacteriota bacterium]
AASGEATATAAPPVVTRVDPAELEAGRPVTLTVTGESFAEGVVVRILANRNAGNSMKPVYEMRVFQPERLSETVLVLDIDRGFSPNPRLRSLVVANPDGAESAPLFLNVIRRMP